MGQLLVITPVFANNRDIIPAMWRFGLLIVSLFAARAGLACDFKYDPAAIPTYYRAEGWSLPGVADFNLKAKPRMYGAPQLTKIPGAIAQLLPHDEDPFIIGFPAQQFVLGGSQQQMRPLNAKAVIVRWMLNNRIIAYSYGLIPVTARRINGQWMVESELACIFTATFIDDKGDGIFRVLVPSALTTHLVPQWARPPKS